MSNQSRILYPYLAFFSRWFEVNAWNAHLVPGSISSFSYYMLRRFKRITILQVKCTFGLQIIQFLSQFSKDNPKFGAHGDCIWTSFRIDQHLQWISSLYIVYFFTKFFCGQNDFPRFNRSDFTAMSRLWPVVRNLWIFIQNFRRLGVYSYFTREYIRWRGGGGGTKDISFDLHRRRIYMRWQRDKNSLSFNHHRQFSRVFNSLGHTIGK